MKIGSLLSLFFTLIIILASCKKKVNVELPFEEDKVVSLLGDMHFAKSASAIYKREDRDSMRTVFESQVFIINGITRNEYEQMVEILESDLNLYYDIEKKVHSYLKAAQNEKS